MVSLSPFHRQGNSGSGWQNALPRSHFVRDGAGVPPRIGGAPKPGWNSLGRFICPLSLQMSLLTPTSFLVSQPAPCNWGRRRPLLPCSIFDNPPCLVEHASTCPGGPASFVLSAGHTTVIAFRHLSMQADLRRQLSESGAHRLSRLHKVRAPSSMASTLACHLNSLCLIFFLCKIGPQRGPLQQSG